MKKVISEKLRKEKERPSVVIATVDKDLDNTYGWHYNWNKPEKGVYWVSEEEATYNFYRQLLTGDRTDNIQGINGIGTKKAEKILEGLSEEVDMYKAVLRVYSISLFGKDLENLDKDKVDKDLLENAYLLWMVRGLDEQGEPIMWKPPEGVYDRWVL